MSDYSLSEADLQTYTAKYYCAIVSISLLLYEYFITLSMEIERFWLVSRISWPVFFFFVNRYVTILGHFPVMLEYFWSSSSPRKTEFLWIFTRIVLTYRRSCLHLESYHAYFVLCVQVYIAALLILRMYALYDRQKSVLALYLTVAAAGFGVASWLILAGKKKGPKETYLIPHGCPVFFEQERANRLAGAWCCLLVFDFLVFALTLYKSIRNYQALRSSRLNRSPSILAIMLRDGGLYFSAMIVCNIANILTFIYGRAFVKGATAIVTNTVSSILISRLMLNLRDPKLKNLTTDPGVITTVAFRHPTTHIISAEPGQYSDHSYGETTYGGIHEEHELGRRGA